MHGNNYTVKYILVTGRARDRGPDLRRFLHRVGPSAQTIRAIWQGQGMVRLDAGEIKPATDWQDDLGFVCQPEF